MLSLELEAEEGTSSDEGNRKKKGGGQSVNVASCKRTCAAGLGMGSLHAWTFAALIGGAAAHRAFFESAGMPIHWLCFSAASLATWLLLCRSSASGPRNERMLSFSLMQAAGTMLMVGAGALQGNEGIPQQAWTVLVVGSCLAGAGSALQIASWGARLRTMTPCETTAATSLSFLLGALGAIGIGAIPEPVSILALCTLPLASGWCAHRDIRVGETAEQSASTAHDAVGAPSGRAQAATLLFCSGLAFGVLGVSMQPFAPDNLTMLANLLTAACAGIALVVGVRARDGAAFGDRLIKSTIAAIAFGIAAVPLFGAGSALMALPFAGIRLLDLTAWAVFSHWKDEPRSFVSSTFVAGRLAINGGTFVGMAAAMPLVRSSDADIPLSLVSAGLLVILMVASAAYFERFSVSSRDRMAAYRTGDLAAAHGKEDPFCALYGIEPEQLLLLERLVAGRSARRIAEEFSLSEATVRTRTTALYRALGVSNRQQLVDLVRGSNRTT